MDAVPLLVKELDALPKTPDKPYWLCGTGQLVRLVGDVPHDDRVWTALERAAKRVDMGQRLEILQSITSCGQGTSQAIQFLSVFLTDTEVRRLKKLDEVIADPDPIKPLGRDLYSGPSAGFVYPTLSVRDFAALQLARLLDMDEHAQPDWTDDEWSAFRSRVQKTLGEYNQKPVKTPQGVGK